MEKKFNKTSLKLQKSHNENKLCIINEVTIKIIINSKHIII